MYTPGVGHVAADGMSRYTYPATKGYQDASKHGSTEDARAMKEIIRLEREAERRCAEVRVAGPQQCWVQVQLRPSPEAAALVAGITTRGGKTTSAIPEARDAQQMEESRDAPSPSKEAKTSDTSRSPPQQAQSSAQEPRPGGPPSPVGQGAATRSRREDGANPQEKTASQTPTTGREGLAVVDHGADVKDHISPAEDPRRQEAGRPRERPNAPKMIDKYGNEVDAPQEDASSSSPAQPVPEAGHGPDPEVEETGPTDDPRGIFEEDWSADYAICPTWGPAWRQTQDDSASWPRGYQVQAGKLIHDARWCIPVGRTGQILRALHTVSGHLGGDRLWQEAGRHYRFAKAADARRLAGVMMRQCETCQACEHPHVSLRLPIEPFPIPSAIMSTVAIDLFQMPEVTWEGEVYNMFAACVDRHSGWVVTTVHHKIGLTAAKVAKAMYEKWWDPFGLPSVVTSDNGPQFAAAWWRTLCGLFGVRQAYSQAYYHPGNGRAEVVGEQLEKRLRKIQADHGICWVEALPRAVRQLHDAPGPSGLSPYEILFGRHRPTAGVPYEPPRVALDAVAFFDHQKEVDQKVAAAMNDLHLARAEKVNKRRREPEAFKVDDKVWWLRPRGRTGDKLETYWCGPCVVKRREGWHSYVIETREGHEVAVHRSHLKAHVEDEYSDEPRPLFYHAQAVEDLGVQVDEWEVERITSHRRDTDGELQFLVKWRGSDKKTWEPVGHFFHRYSQDFIDYCKQARLRPDIVTYLADHPPETTVVQLVTACGLGPGVMAPNLESDPDSGPSSEVRGVAISEGHVGPLRPHVVCGFSSSSPVLPPGCFLPASGHSGTPPPSAGQGTPTIPSLASSGLPSFPLGQPSSVLLQARGSEAPPSSPGQANLSAICSAVRGSGSPPASSGQASSITQLPRGLGNSSSWPGSGSLIFSAGRGSGSPPSSSGQANPTLKHISWSTAGGPLFHPLAVSGPTLFPPSAHPAVPVAMEAAVRSNRPRQAPAAGQPHARELA